MTRWEPSFVAVGVLLGEPLDAMLEALALPLRSGADALALKLRDGSREVRAQALARVVADVALALDKARLA